MFGSVFQTEAIYFGIKVGGALLLFGLWWWYVQKSVRPWANTARTDGQPGPEFPITGLLVMIGLSIGFAFFVSMEPAFRATTENPSTIEAQRRRAAEERDALGEKPVFVPDGVTLDERTKKAVEENAKQAQEARDRFQKLPPVQSNGTGGAQPRPADPEKGKKEPEMKEPKKE